MSAFRWEKSQVAFLLLALGGSFIIVFPLLPLIYCSLTGKLFWSWMSFGDFSLIRYAKAIGTIGFSYVNSGIASTTAVVLNLLICTPAAYAFSRFRFRYRSALQNTIIGIYAVPLVSGFVPLFILFKWYGLLNTLFALSLVGAVISLPLNTWFAVDYFNTIPEELEDSAMTDGCSRIQVLLRIVLPLASPALVTMALITFLITWNEFMLAVIFLNTFENFTFPVAVLSVGTGYQGTQDWGIVSACVITGLAPVLVIFSVLRKYMIAGLTKGAVKM